MRFDGGEYIGFLAVYTQMLGKGWDAPRALLMLFHVSCFFCFFLMETSYWPLALYRTMSWNLAYSSLPPPPVNLHFFAYLCSDVCLFIILPANHFSYPFLIITNIYGTFHYSYFLPLHLVSASLLPFCHHFAYLTLKYFVLICCSYLSVPFF